MSKKGKKTAESLYDELRQKGKQSKQDRVAQSIIAVIGKLPDMVEMLTRSINAQVEAIGNAGQHQVSLAVALEAPSYLELKKLELGAAAAQRSDGFGNFEKFLDRIEPGLVSLVTEIIVPMMERDSGESRAARDQAQADLYTGLLDVLKERAEVMASVKVREYGDVEYYFNENPPESVVGSLDVQEFLDKRAEEAPATDN